MPAKCGNSFLVRFKPSSYKAPTSTLLPPLFPREKFPTNFKNVSKFPWIFNLNGIKNRIRGLNYDCLPILVSMYKYKQNSSPIRDPLGRRTQLNVLDFTSCYQGERLTDESQTTNHRYICGTEHDICVSLFFN